MILSKISLGEKGNKIPLLKPGWISSVLHGYQGPPPTPDHMVCGFVICVWELPLPGCAVLDESVSILSLSAFIFKMGTRRDTLPSSQGYPVDVPAEQDSAGVWNWGSYAIIEHFLSGSSYLHSG